MDLCRDNVAITHKITFPSYSTPVSSCIRNCKSFEANTWFKKVATCGQASSNFSPTEVVHLFTWKHNSKKKLRKIYHLKHRILILLVRITIIVLHWTQIESESTNRFWWEKFKIQLKNFLLSTKIILIFLLNTLPECPTSRDLLKHEFHTFQHYSTEKQTERKRNYSL